MAATDTQLINLTYLENRLGELDLKIWWIAETIGVDRKTVGRWLSGKVKTIKTENLLALAQCLQCEPADLVLTDTTLVIASKEEQAIAAELIVQENLLATLTPLGQWPLLESIVKATMQPNLPLPVMGKLYNLLSICAWRQDQLEKAMGFAKKAKQIGEGIGHRGVIAQANCNLGILHSFQGRLQQSIPLYEAVISERNFLTEPRSVGAALSNLGQDYQTYGDFEKSREYQLDAIAIYTSLKLPLNLTIAFCSVGLLELELGNLGAATEAFARSSEFAKASNYLRGMAAATMYLGDCACRSGDLATADALLAEGWSAFAELKLQEALNYEIKARWHRRHGEFDLALSVLQEGLRYAKDFPHEQASLNLEFSALWSARGELEKAELAIRASAEIYSRSGAVLRAGKLLQRLVGSARD